MGRIIEGFWDCKSCNTKGIRGGIHECPNCGKARDENTIFYLDLEKKRYVPEEQEKNISRNPDWVCSYCNQLNSDNDQFCVACGAGRTKENLNYFENRSKKLNEEKKKEVKDESEINNQESNSFSQYILNLFSALHNFSFFKASLYILVTLAILAVASGIIYLFIPKVQELTVTEMSWQRSIDIDRYRTVEESDWSLPYGARLLYTQEEFSHNEQVLDHYETKTRQVAHERISGYEDYVSGYRDLGNGYFEEIISSRPIYETYYETEEYQEPVYRDEPIYQTKYYYEIDKWIYERSVTTEGTDKEPYWEDVILDSDEKVSKQSERYYITGLNQKNKSSNVELSFDEWNSLEVGQTVKVKVSLLGTGQIVK